MKAYKYEISNGTTAEIFFNDHEGKWQLNHFDDMHITRMGLFTLATAAVKHLEKMANAWGGFTVSAKF